MQDDNKKWAAILIVLCGAASYGVLSTIVKLGYGAGFHVDEITGSQVLFASVALWIAMLCKQTAFAYSRNKPGKRESGVGGQPSMNHVPKATWKDRVKLAASGTLTGLTGVFYYYSLQWLDASVAILLLFQFTWMGMLLDWFTRQIAPAKSKWIAIIVILAGTAFASGIWRGIGSDLTASGIGLGLLAAICYTFFMQFSGRVAVHLPTLQRTTWMVTGAAIAVLLIFPPQFVWNGAIGQGLWLWGSLLAFFGMILPPYLFAKGAPQLETGLTTILGSIELPVVILCSMLVLGEQIGVFQWIGVLLILGGIMISERR